MLAPIEGADLESFERALRCDKEGFASTIGAFGAIEPTERDSRRFLCDSSLDETYAESLRELSLVVWAPVGHEPNARHQEQTPQTVH